jgi:hypothetical protein
MNEFSNIQSFLVHFVHQSNSKKFSQCYQYWCSNQRINERNSFKEYKDNDLSYDFLKYFIFIYSIHVTFNIKIFFTNEIK